MNWHVDVETLARYQAGSIDRVSATSVEAHVTRCAECRSSLTVEDDWLERSWLGIVDEVEPSRPVFVERVLNSVGVPAHWARIAAATPALRLSFLFAVGLVVGFAAIASHTTQGDGSYRVFLAVAPIIPVVGVAFAYGRLVDPAYELTMSSPVDSLRLLLLRASIVLSISILFGVAAWPLVPAPGVLGMSAWLLPSLALTLVTLALASRLEIWMAAATAGLGWGIVLFLSMAQETDIFGGRAQLAYVGLICAAGFAIVMRRNSYDREGRLR